MKENWINIGRLDEIPLQGARVVETSMGDIAIFRTKDNKVYALRDQCPHKGGPLSQGIVSGNRVSCPLHDWKIQLDTGLAVAPDEGCAATFEVKVENEEILLLLNTDVLQATA